MPEYGSQVSPEEILFLTGAKVVKRLHGRETAEDLLQVAEVSRSRLRMALLFSVTLLILLVRDANVLGMSGTGHTIITGTSSSSSTVGGNQPHAVSLASSYGGGAALINPSITLASTTGATAAASTSTSQDCITRRVIPSNPEATLTPESKEHLSTVHATCFRPPLDWSLTRVLPPLQPGDPPLAAYHSVLVGSQCAPIFAPSRVECPDWPTPSQDHPQQQDPFSPHPLTSSSIVLATHLTTERLPTLAHSAEVWGGCISVTISLCTLGEWEGVLATWAQSPHLQAWASVHVLLGDGAGPYPYNPARNVALEPLLPGHYPHTASGTALAPWFVMVDGDGLLSVGAKGLERVVSRVLDRRGVWNAGSSGSGGSGGGGSGSSSAVECEHADEPLPHNCGRHGWDGFRWASHPTVVDSAFQRASHCPHSFDPHSTFFIIASFDPALRLGVDEAEAVTQAILTAGGDSSSLNAAAGGGTGAGVATAGGGSAKRGSRGSEKQGEDDSRSRSKTGMTGVEVLGPHAALVTALEKGVVTHQAAAYPDSYQGMVHWGAWKRTGKCGPLPTHYSYVFEPYFVAKGWEGFPLFDEWYRGAGWDKNSFFLEATTRGLRVGGGEGDSGGGGGGGGGGGEVHLPPYSLVLLPDVFILNRQPKRAGAGATTTTTTTTSGSGSGSGSTTTSKSLKPGSHLKHSTLPAQPQLHSTQNRPSNSAKFWGWCKDNGLACHSRCTVQPLGGPSPTPDARAVDYGAEERVAEAKAALATSLAALKLASGGKSVERREVVVGAAAAGAGAAERGECRVEVGWDYYQPSNPTFTATSPGQCCDICREYEACGSWTYRESTHSCWLKANAMGRREVGGEDLISGNVTAGGGGEEEGEAGEAGEVGEVGVEASNEAVTPPPLKTPPPSSSTTAGRKGGGDKGEEEAGVEEPAAAASAAAADVSAETDSTEGQDDEYDNLPTCSAEEDWDYYQKDNHEVKAKTEEECCAACAAVPGCKAWTLRARTSSCWLKTSAEGRKVVVGAGLISGNVTGGGATEGKCRLEEIPRGTALVCDSRSVKVVGGRGKGGGV